MRTISHLRRLFAFFLTAFLAVTFITTTQLFAAPKETGGSSVDSIVAQMTLDEKLSQMIIPAIRAWNGTNVTDLSAVPALAEALRRHQYGGVILFGSNITGTEQVTRLVSDLQKNNAAIETVSTKIPYLLPLDEEGGIVLRLSMGTRMTGNMALGATGENAAENAEKTGVILGEELSAIGFNADFAPVVDVNNNPNNPVIGSRSFSDDPDLVSSLGMAYADGLISQNIIPTFKHYPGHGDTDTDSHIGTPSVNKSYEELLANELVPYANAIANGADMIMTAHITFPGIDEPVTFADGTTGHYPATMSKHLITDILRNDLGFDGVVVTDALEMAALYSNPLVEGEAGSVEYASNLAEKIIGAGVDILLIPTDLNTDAAVGFYDEYIEALIDKVKSDAISMERINESVTRILSMKEKYGILDADTSGDDIEARVENAKQTVGSDAHHAAEKEIARQAVTLVQNKDLALPLSGINKKIVLLGRDSYDQVALRHAVRELMSEGLISEDAYDNGLITIDYYFTSASAPPNYSDALKAAISDADAVICLSKTFGASALNKTNPQYIAISTAIEDVHAGGGKFILLSDNLPYDAARYPDADGILLAYMGSGLDTDPTARGEAETTPAYNANVIEAIKAAFDDMPPKGVLPVVIPKVGEDAAGNVSFTDETAFERGFGMRYAYQFTEGMGSTYEKKSMTPLDFKNNARYDLLSAVCVDGKELDASSYEATNDHTNLTLQSAYLETLSAGEHTLTAVYDYDGEAVIVETTFTVTGEETPAPGPDSPDTPDPKPEPETSPSTQPKDQAAPAQQSSKSQATTQASAANTGDATAALPYLAAACIAACVLRRCVLALRR